MSGESDSEEKHASDDEVVAIEASAEVAGKDPAQTANPGPGKPRRRTATLTKKKVPRKKGSMRRSEGRRRSSSAADRDSVTAQLANLFAHVPHARLDEIVAHSYKGDGNIDACVAALRELQPAAPALSSVVSPRTSSGVAPPAISKGVNSRDSGATSPQSKQPQHSFVCPTCNSSLSNRDELAEHSRAHSSGALNTSAGAFPGIKMRHRSSLFMNGDKPGGGGGGGGGAGGERIRLPPLSAYNDAYFDW